MQNLILLIATRLDFYFEREDSVDSYSVMSIVKSLLACVAVYSLLATLSQLNTFSYLQQVLPLNVLPEGARESFPVSPEAAMSTVFV